VLIQTLKQAGVQGAQRLHRQPRVYGSPSLRRRSQVQGPRRLLALLHLRRLHPVCVGREIRRWVWTTIMVTSAKVI